MRTCMIAILFTVCAPAILGLAVAMLADDRGRAETDERVIVRLGHGHGASWLVTEKSTGCQFISDINGLRPITPGCKVE